MATPFHDLGDYLTIPRVTGLRLSPDEAWLAAAHELHAEGYGAVAGAIDGLKGYAPGGGRSPRFAQPLVCPSLLPPLELPDELPPLLLELLEVLPPLLPELDELELDPELLPVPRAALVEFSVTPVAFPQATRKAAETHNVSRRQPALKVLFFMLLETY